MAGLEEHLCGERLKRLNLTTPKTRSIRGDLIEAFKIFKGLGDLSIEYLYQRRPLQKSQLREHPFMLETPKAWLDVRRNSFSHRIVCTWNSLPPSVVECDTLNTSKNRIDEHFNRTGLV